MLGSWGPFAGVEMDFKSPGDIEDNNCSQFSALCFHESTLSLQPRVNFVEFVCFMNHITTCYLLMYPHNPA